MRLRSPWLLAAAALLWVACKDPETVAEVKRIRTAAEQLEQGKQYLAQGRPDLALPEFKSAAASLPGDPMPQLQLARAQRELGNDAAAILALKQAVELSRGGDVGLKKQLADMLRQEGYADQALPLYVELRDQNALTDPEILDLTRLQAAAGDSDGAFKTLERIQKVRPDDVEAKVVEAEVLLTTGEETLAMKILDRLIADQPKLASARLARARHLLNSKEAEQALAELDPLDKADAGRADVAALKADILCALERYEEADSALGQLLEDRPRDPELLSRLAEVKLALGAASTAEMLVEQSLGARPRNARGTYVKGRILEAQGDLAGAQEQFAAALKSDPSFAPALSRSWRVYRQQGDLADAMSALERLLSMDRASPDEKVALAELYAESKTHLPRARKLVAEAIRRDPKSDHLRELEKQLGKDAPPAQKKKPFGGIEIISGGRRH